MRAEEGAENDEEPAGHVQSFALPWEKPTERVIPFVASKRDALPARSSRPSRGALGERDRRQITKSIVTRGRRTDSEVQLPTAILARFESPDQSSHHPAMHQA